ncbi:MAG TPA: FAD-dependent oxidoreductase [Rhabdochlamydiaceae bacterium]|nr:FAD-dependent oxidoreductase [Rhabdochlamydiaceae bacterium]
MKKKACNVFLCICAASISLNAASAPSVQVQPQKNKIVVSKVQEEIYPVVILGSGVGALTAAIYLQRAGVDTLVIEGMTPGGTIIQSHMVQNWPGEMGISGQKLVDKIHEQAKENGAQFLSEEVISVDFSSQPYTITTRDLLKKDKIRQIKASSCIIGLGSSPNRLGVAGEEEKGGYWANGVYTCATCDGALYKNKTVAVVGGGDSALIEADYLSNLAKKVYIIVRSSEFRHLEAVRKNLLLQKPNITVLYNTQVQEIQGNGKRVTNLLVDKDQEKQSVEVDAVFLAIGATPNSNLFKNQLEIDAQGYIVLKNGQETSKKGIFAIGDIVDRENKQAITAAGDGAKAAIQAERHLSLMGPSKVRISNIARVIAASSPLVELSKESDFDSLIQNSNVIVDFYSPSCGPCKKLSPIFDAAVENHADKYQFVKVNISEFSELAQKYDVVGVPTVIVFKNGSEVERKTGLDAIQALLDRL